MRRVRAGALRGSLLLAVATLGVAAVLSLLLLGVGPTYGGIVDGSLWILAITTASVALGWLASRLLPAPIALLAAPLLPILAVSIVLAIKVARWPSFPAVGDGFEIVVAGYAASGLVGAMAERSLRARRLPEQVIAAEVIALLVIAATFSIQTVGWFSGR